MKNATLLSLSVAGSLLAGPLFFVSAQAAPLTKLLASNDPKLALSQLTSGVQEVDAPGLTGAVSAFSANAFPVVAGKIGKDGRESVVAAAFAGRGRIVAFGHDGYLLSSSLGVKDTGALLDNAITWVSGGQKPAKVGVIASGDEVLNAMKSRGFNAQAVKTDALADYNTLVVNGHALKDADLAPLQAFLARGGGLVIATTGWGWNYNTPNLDLAHDYVGNRLLAPYGLVWTTGTPGKTSPAGLKVEPISPFVNALAAFDAISAQKTLLVSETEQVSSTLGDLLSGLPADDTLIYPRLMQFASGARGEVVPFERRPVKNDNPTARLTLVVQNRLTKNLPAGEIKPNPAGVIFPGDVPSIAKPTTTTLSIDTSIPEWHSLGLYAAPGATVSVKMPDGVDSKGYQIRIGCHTDALWNLDSWKRAPEISRAFPLQKGETKVANPFGGLVYIVVPGGAKAGKIDVTITGAYAAPLYVAGQTDLAQWNHTIRWAPGPWAEIATDKIILTVPSRDVRDLDDPAALCAFYDRGMDAAADLYGISRDRKRPERIVADMQISAGYMHSGYPIMTGIDVEKTTVDLPTLTKFPWGHFHELGHNHQKGEWTFGGTGEVTNNLLPLYVWNTILGHDLDSGHPALAPDQWAKRWAKYDAGGRQFKEWQSDPWLALEMYMQMQKAFGWEPFKKVFAEYGALGEAQKLKAEEQKHDQWMVRMSRATGKNLGPFFVEWGVPTSQAARDSIRNLGAWMPTFPAPPATAQLANLATR